ncbi:heavy-metal-associated domain-containing protein [Hydrogenophaga sp. IBVHS2]|uniref:heavy-metal-associated domain-containing protein n=1 Tax=Hydrogenophaga sp. IBVHS2 TaxID=1985170 RepID=UPI000A2DF025|nr:heavy-metal-associated domain-containing protein [Hydrogenophaga sp. IBVHS2]OSZ63354.1 heavy metal transport/detoxification protein [Hydrogenophaga sp. IBVHS2]
MEHVFQVQGMTCGHCEKAVQQAIRQVDPQAQVQIDRPQGRVAVNSTAAADALKTAIREEGYAVA